MLSRIVLFSGAAVLITLAALAVGCGGSGSDADSKDEIVAAFYPLAFAAEQIAANGRDVRDLTPAGAEPHDLELTPSDVRAVHEASLVLYLGDGFMPGLETAVEQRQGRSLDVLAELRQQGRLRRRHRRRPPCLARSASLRRDCAADRSRSRERDRRRTAGQPGRSSSTASIVAASRTVLAVKSSRVTPRSAISRRGTGSSRFRSKASRPKPSRPPGILRGWSTSSELRRDDGLLRDASVAQARGDGCTRSRREDRGARSAGGNRVTTRSPEAPTTSP